MVAALFQILIGFSGLVGFMLRFIGPLTIAPTITLVGLALLQAAADFSGEPTGLSLGSSRATNNVRRGGARRRAQIKSDQVCVGG